MRTVPFLSVLEGALFAGGLNPPDASDDIKAELTAHINTAYRMGFEMYDWPEGLSYVEADIITHPTITGAKYVPYIAVGHDIKTVMGCADYDPRVVEDFHAVRGYRLGVDGIYFPGTSRTKVWIEYRGPASKFTTAAWNSVTAYSAGALVFDATSGNCYKALQASTNQAVTQTAYWAVVPFLAVLDQAVMTAAHQARTRAAGREDVAALIQGVMEEQLDNEIGQLELQMGRNKRWGRR